MQLSASSLEYLKLTGIKNKNGLHFPVCYHWVLLPTHLVSFRLCCEPDSQFPRVFPLAVKQ
jgi:hypothetical protein